MLIHYLLTQRPDRINSIEDLKVLSNKIRILRNAVLATVSVVLLLPILLRSGKPLEYLTFLLVSVLFYVLFLFINILKVSKYPKISDFQGESIGRFQKNEIQDIVDDVSRKMNTTLEFDIRIVPTKHIQAETSRPILRRIFKNKNILAFHEGLLHVVSKSELKAIIAHEAAHHIQPGNVSNIIGEYWADYYACKYIDPVAMANALIKIDQNEFLYYVFLRRCAYLANALIGTTNINQEFWDYIFQNIPIPFKSKRDANRSAKQLIRKYMKDNQIAIAKQNWFIKVIFRLTNKLSGDILNRKKLSEMFYINWAWYDKRIKDNYLDKYELINMYNVLKNRKITINRLFFYDIPGSTHPSTNRRLIFIINNFLLPPDYSYKRLFDKDADNRLNK